MKISLCIICPYLLSIQRRLVISPFFAFQMNFDSGDIELKNICLAPRHQLFTEHCAFWRFWRVDAVFDFLQGESRLGPWTFGLLHIVP